MSTDDEPAETRLAFPIAFGPLLGACVGVLAGNIVLGAALGLLAGIVIGSLKWPGNPGGERD
jgi:hypothetical protein